MVRGVHTLLHNCLEQAVAERLILTNPAQGCKLPQLEKREMKILPQEKIGMYLAEAERRGLLAAFYLELTTGLRRGELLALQWTDLDVENRTLAVTKQVNRINGELVVSPPKTKFYSHIGPSTAGSRPTDCRAQKAPSQPVPISVLQDRDYV